MKRFLFAAMLVVVAPAFAADVGVSVTVGQPGFYGHIDIGNFPQPQVIYPAPVVIQAPPVGVAAQPLYLHVPPGHAKHWRKHCHEYNACGQPVYFVKDDWYNNVYAPHYREQHGDDRDHEHDEHHEHEGEQGEHHGEHRDHGHDHGKGHGNGHHDD
jgi:hypothetical protein